MLEFDEAWQQLFEKVKYGWTSKHEQFCENLNKRTTIF